MWSIRNYRKYVLHEITEVGLEEACPSDTAPGELLQQSQ